MTDPMRIGDDPGNQGDSYDSAEDVSMLSDDSTVLQQLAEATREEVHNEPLYAAVPNRESQRIEVRYSTDVEGPRLQAWARSCRPRRNRAQVDAVDMDNMKLAFIILTEMCECIIIGDKEVRGPDHALLDFKHPHFMKMMNTMDVNSAIRKLYGSDGHISATSQEIVSAAGFGDLDVIAADPTKASTKKSGGDQK